MQRGDGADFRAGSEKFRDESDASEGCVVVGDQVTKLWHIREEALRGCGRWEKLQGNSYPTSQDQLKQRKGTQST